MRLINFREYVYRAELLDFLVECRQKYGSVFRVWFGLECNVYFCDPDDVRVSMMAFLEITKRNDFNYPMF